MYAIPERVLEYGQRLESRVVAHRLLLTQRVGFENNAYMHQPWKTSN
jgi:hypothetical protein